MNAKYNFSDKVVIVTGSAQGIGKAIAEEFYKSGAFVVISDIARSRGEEVASLLGERAIFLPCDVSQQGQVNTLVDNTLLRFGKLDVMVNNAGVNAIRPEDRVTIDKYPDETWHKMIDIDLHGTYYCCKAASKAMLQRKTGAIINVASVAGVVALRLQIGFVAAKAAILKMTEAIACELGPSGIRVNAVSPGSTVTEATRKLFYGKEGSFSQLAERVISFIPQGRPGDAMEVADAVVFLASDSASYITGHNIVVDGGWISGFSRDF